MKNLPLFCSLAVVLLLASCTAPVVRRIERNPEVFNALSERQKAMVSQRKIEEGMSKGAVFIAWGRPDRASKGTKTGKTYERWSYAGYDLVSSYGGGYGYGGLYGHRYVYDPLFYYDPVTYVPYEAGWVEFLNGKVSAWSVTR